MAEVHVRVKGDASKGMLVLYGVMPGDEAIPEGLLGLADAPVRTVDAGGLRAVCSVSPAGRLRPERRHLAAHQRVVQALASAGTILPVAFGMIFPGEGRLRALLEEHAETFGEQIGLVRGRAEMTVRVGLSGESVFAHFVERSAELRALRDEIASGRAGHDTKMRAGRLFETLLSERRDEALAIVRERLDPVCVDIAPGVLRAEKDLVHVACLVERGRLSELEGAVELAAERFDDAHTFTLSGPWPAHSFVSVRLNGAGGAREAGETDGASAGIAEAA
jgi:hypothetical protein